MLQVNQVLQSLQNCIHLCLWFTHVSIPPPHTVLGKLKDVHPCHLHPTRLTLSKTINTTLQAAKSHSSPGQPEQGGSCVRDGYKDQVGSVIEYQYANPEGPCARAHTPCSRGIEAFPYLSVTSSQGRVVHKRDPGLSIIYRSVVLSF